jgi:hypothetical protein
MALELLRGKLDLGVAGLTFGAEDLKIDDQWFCNL